MIDIFNYIFKNSWQVTYSNKNKLLFENDDYYIEFSFNNDKKNEIEVFERIEQKDLEQIEYNGINSCKICGYENLSDREEISGQNGPISLCKALYQFIIIVKNYNLDAVLKTSLELKYEDDSLFCDVEPNYVFEIEINSKIYSDLNFFLFCIPQLKIDQSNLIPHKGYWYFYKNQKSFSDNRQIFILNSNTKVRRLGYLKLIADLIKSKNKISANYINKKFENYSLEFIHDLKTYKNTKGMIKETKTGISAQPYIVLAKELGFLYLLNNIYLIGKKLKVYLVLKDEMRSANENVFTLSSLDKLFFLENILQKDYLYISSLVEILFILKQTTYYDILTNFQNHILNKLDDFTIRLQKEHDQKSYRKIKTIAERIKKWEKPEVYLEHILMPRLNWLLDLEIIEMDDKLNISLTNIGETFFSHLCSWNDINCENIINPDDFIETFIINLFDDCYYKNNSETKNIEKDILYKKIDYLIERCFEKFKTLAPNRVTLSQAITYTKYKLYLNDGIKVSSQFIKNYLSQENQEKYIYKYQKQYGDGYIQIRK